MYTLDTNAILYYLKDDSEAVSILRGIFAQNVPLNVSAITELELFSFPNLSAKEEKLIEELLTTVAVIPVDSHIARLAAFIRRQYRLKVPDSAIAATAMFTGSTLVTRNTRDFRRVRHMSSLKVQGRISIRLKDQVASVTSAAQGIGTAYASDLAKDGTKGYLSFDPKKESPLILTYANRSAPGI